MEVKLECLDNLTDLLKRFGRCVPTTRCWWPGVLVYCVV